MVTDQLVSNLVQNIQGFDQSWLSEVQEWKTWFNSFMTEAVII